MGRQIIEASNINYPNYVIRTDGVIIGKKFKKPLLPQVNTNGYHAIRLKDKLGIAKTLTVHKLISDTFLGQRPANCDTDHIDRCKTNNNLSNLRYISRALNNFNKHGNKNNTSGYKGVAWHHQHGLWRAYIMLDYKQKHLGLFDTPEKANEARIKAEIKYGLRKAA